MSEAYWLPWAAVTNHHSLHSLTALEADVKVLAGQRSLPGSTGGAPHPSSSHPAPRSPGEALCEAVALCLTIDCLHCFNIRKTESQKRESAQNRSMITDPKGTSNCVTPFSRSISEEATLSKAKKCAVWLTRGHQEITLAFQTTHKQILIMLLRLL